MSRLARSVRKPPRVLVIDDDPGLPEVLELLLSREGYDALHAATVKDGLERVASAAPDVVITDLKLPDGTGLAQRDRARAHARHRSQGAVDAAPAVGSQAPALAVSFRNTCIPPMVLLPRKL